MMANFLPTKTTKWRCSGETKVAFPSFAAHLGLSIDEFKALNNETNRRWKKVKQTQFPIFI